MTDPTLGWLRDVEALRQLPQRYARAIDARDIDAVGRLFDPDGTVDGVRGSARVPAYLDTYAVVHQLRPPESPDPDMMLGMHYLDDVVRRDTAWLIHHRRSTMLWSRPMPR